MTLDDIAKEIRERAAQDQHERERQRAIERANRDAKEDEKIN